MSVDSATALRMSRLIHASPQAVWDAWTQPEHMKKWSCPQPGGVKDVQVDFRIGGAFELLMEVEGNTYTAFGTYEEIDEPVRLVYTWDWQEPEHATGATRVVVEFESRGEDTEVRLTHEGFATVEAKDGHSQGWGACFAHFEALFV